MIEISTDLIEQAVYKLCFDANICLNNKVYDKIYGAYQTAQNPCKDILRNILLNAKTAYEKKLPLCQDTGQVIIFVKIGHETVIKGGILEDCINKAVEKCYKDNFFRKSVVKNAVFDRTNTKTNTPVIIYTKHIEGDEIKISVLIKGAGSENKSKLSMVLPSIGEDELIKECAKLIFEAEENSCPPMFIGIGIGGTADKALLLSKEAFICDDFTTSENQLGEKIKDCVNSKYKSKYGENYVLDVRVKTFSTHIACMPVGITVNCHSDRTAKCIIKGGIINYVSQKPEFKEIETSSEVLKEIKTDDIESLKKLQQGEKFLLTGEIYVARDMAHKRMFEMLSRGEELPIPIKDGIIFYAGPCPNKQGEIIGSIGPTTAGRMDKYAIEFYKQGLLATIGKGGRCKDVERIIKEKKAKYFTAYGGIAALLSEKVKKCEIIAFEDLGTEAIYKLEVEKFPLIVEI